MVEATYQQIKIEKGKNANLSNRYKVHYRLLKYGIFSGSKNKRPQMLILFTEI